MPACAPSCRAGVADFVIDDETVHGVAGLVRLFGIESTGLTAALALVDEMAARLTAD